MALENEGKFDKSFGLIKDLLATIQKDKGKFSEVVLKEVLERASFLCILLQD